MNPYINVSWDAERHRLEEAEEFRLGEIHEFLRIIYFLKKKYIYMYIYIHIYV